MTSYRAMSYNAVMPPLQYQPAISLVQDAKNSTGCDTRSRLSLHKKRKVEQLVRLEVKACQDLTEV